LRKQMSEQLAQARSKLALLEAGIHETEGLREAVNAAVANRLRAAEMELKQVEIAAPTSTPFRHTNTSSLVIALTIVGALAGWVLGLLREMTLTKIRGARDLLQRFKIAPVAGIPTISSLPLDHALRATGPAVEALKKLCLKILSVPHPEGKGAIVSVLSPRDGAGKTCVCANAAALVAASGKRVLLVDACIAGNTLSRQLGVTGSKSIYTLAAQPQWSSSLAVEKNGFFVLPSSAEGGAGLLTRDRLTQLIDQMRVQYDLILIDSPSLLTSAGASAIASISDAWVFVIPSRAATNLEVERSIELLGSTEPQRLLVIINRVDSLDLAADGFIA
jgi:Mrp family chromosome partitioning ATPase